jgi:DNA-binding LacI/PurR family transcriptional regulator
MSASILAKKLGLSLSTVDRALSKPEAVSSEVLQSIHSTAKALNLDLQKRSPRGRPAKHRLRAAGKLNLGVWFVGGDEQHAYRFVGAQIALLRAACENVGFNYQFLFSSSVDDIPAAVQAGEVDAVLLEGLMPSARALDFMVRMPAVWIMTRRSMDYPGDFVEPDNETNGRIAADYLADRGHRRVAYVATEPDYPAFARREASFTARCATRGLQVVRSTALQQLKHLHLRPLPGKDVEIQLASGLLGARSKPTAIYLPNDIAAGPLSSGLRQLGANPEEFDWIIGDYSPHIPGSVWSALHPRPAGIDINLNSIIRVAVEIVSLRVRQKDIAGRIGVQISPRLVPPPHA